MDLAAYMQIGDLEQIAKDNEIEVPRLRGYRLMKSENPVSNDDIRKLFQEAEVGVCENLCRANPFWNANAHSHTYGWWTDEICNYYMFSKVDENGKRRRVGIRWDRIHGKKRKVLKFEIKKQKRRIQKQFDVWNKYVGNENVLYIHSRIGGGNWDAYGGNELSKQPWFLEKVDDYFDSTYCDIYALIK